MDTRILVIGLLNEDYKSLSQYFNKNFTILSLEKLYETKIDFSNFEQIYILNYKENINIKELIRNRININLNKILDGEYNLEQINFKILLDKYNKIINKIKNKELINFDKLFEKISKFTENKFLFVTLSKKYSDTLPVKECLKNINKIGLQNLINNIHGFELPWVSLIDLIHNNKQYFKKGYIGKNPFIEEIVENSFQLFERPGFLYKIPFDKCIQKGYKFKLIDDVKILEVLEIPSIKLYFEENGIKLIKKV